MTVQDGLWFDTTKLFVGGEWRNGGSGETIDVENPSTGEVVDRIARGNAADIDASVAAATRALEGPWGKLSAAERGSILMRMARLVEERAETLAYLESTDVGKPISQARGDAKALARYFEFYGGAADKITGETIPYQSGTTVLTLREPHGVTGHIIPWNYPMQIFGRSIGAALAMGNACVVKPAEDASLTSLAIAGIAVEAGLPAGALNVVTGYGHDVGAALSAHPDVHHLSFTGSVGTGRRIQEAASANVVPVTLELGGKSPHIVFDDCDLEAAMPTLYGACIQAAGQTCSAASRVLVQRGVYEKVKAEMATAYNGLVVGSASADRDLGPIVSGKQKAIVSEFIARGRTDLTVAGEGSIHADAPSGGHYVAPVLFADVAPDHALAQDEIFGPVQVLIPFEDEEEALAIANGTDYGLVAGVWTENGARQMRMARRLHCGQVFINNYGAGGGVELPFGGVGKSGHGREKGFEALYGFSRLKTIAIKHG